MLLQGCAEKAPQYQEMILVFSGVLDGNILEQTTLCIKTLVLPGPDLLAMLKHAPHPAVPSPHNIARKKCSAISSSPSVAIAATIALSNLLPSGDSRSVLK